MKRVLEDHPDVLNDFFGDDVWQQEFKNAVSEGHTRSGRTLLDIYERRLKNLGYVETHDFTLIKNTVGVPLYHLVFASKHPRGKDFWNKISQRTPTGQRRML
jgi:three-Cys-motif partner protein